MSAVFIFKINGAKKVKTFNFLKAVRNGWPYGCDFRRIFRDLCEASKKFNFTVF